MTDTQLRCAGCGHRFGRKSRSVVVVATYALCGNCANDIDVHSKLFIGCTQRHAPTAHTALGEPPALITRGRAAQILKSSPPEGIIAS